MKKLSRTIASKFMHGVTVVSIFCAYSQDAIAKPFEFAMHGTYVDNYSLARWSDGGSVYQYAYFMDESFFGNHEVLATQQYHVPNAGTETRIKKTFDDNITQLQYWGLPGDALYSRTVHENLYYMFDVINRSLKAKPTYDVPFGGVKIPNAIAKAFQQMAKDLTTPNAELTIAPVAQTSDLTCTSTTSASRVVVQALPTCRNFVALLSIFHFLNALNAFMQWAEDNPNAAGTAFNGAIVATAGSILFFAYEYYNAAYQIETQEQSTNPVQSDLDNALEIGEAGTDVVNALYAFVQAVATHNHSTPDHARISAVPTAMINAERVAATQAADPNVPRPPTFPPVGSE